MELRSDVMVVKLAAKDFMSHLTPYNFATNDPIDITLGTYLIKPRRILSFQFLIHLTPLNCTVIQQIFVI